MKRFNLWIACSFMCYLILALAMGYGVKRVAAQSGRGYNVEINRLMNSLSEESSFDRLDLRSYEFIQSVSYLSAVNMGDSTAAGAFYEEENHVRTVIRPLFEEGIFLGLLRFDCLESEFDISSIMFLAQFCLCLMELLVLVVFLYIKFQILKPFERMSSIPEDLSKGHLTGIVKEEKNQYFNRFLWGIGQLKDHLEISRKRELELVKEKKKLLLSLSHDIKTPLNTIKLYSRALEKNLYTDKRGQIHAAHQIGMKASEIDGYLKEIIKSSREDILDIQVEKGSFYLKDLMKKVLETYTEPCSMRMVDLTVGKYENLLIKGDMERTLEVIGNLFENAFKYGDGRRIEITFSEEDYCQLIHIFNTGSIISDTDFNHIFESFFRASNSTGKQGHGLGLYICREIMRKMEGEIYGECRREGMAFILVLPL